MTVSKGQTLIEYETITVEYTEWGQYEYFASFCVSFGYREIPTLNANISVKNIWANGKLIYRAGTGSLLDGLKWYFRPGTEDQSAVPGHELAYRGQILLWFQKYPLGPSPSGLPTISVELMDTAVPTIGDAVSSFAIRAGYDAADIVLVNMTDPIIGYILDGDATLEALVSETAFLYDFTMVEVGGTVTFAHKYVAGNLTIDGVVNEARLAVLSEGGGDQQLNVIERAGDAALPRSIAANYFDVDNAFGPGQQIASRDNGPNPSHGSTQDLSVSLPIIATGGDIRSRLFDALYRSWSMRNGHSIRVPAEFIKFNPGEVITYTVYDATYTGMIVKSLLNADYSVSLSLAEKNAEYLPITVNTEAPTPAIPIVGYTDINCVFLDIPDITADLEEAGRLNYRVAIGGAAPGTWRGGRIDMAYASQPGNWLTVLTTAAEAGMAVLAVEPTDYNGDIDVLDATTELTVTLRNMTLTALQDAIVAGTNLVAVGNTSRYELMTYDTVTAIDALTVKLSGLMRGRFGTENFINGHTLNDNVVIVAETAVVGYSMYDYLENSRILYRAIPVGMPDHKADVKAFAPLGNSRKPYPPQDVVVAISATTGDAVITWKEQLRFTGEPLPKTYVVGIYSSDWLRILRYVRNIEAPLFSETASFTYTAAMRLQDGTNLDPHVNVLVHQQNLSHGVLGWPSGGMYLEPIFVGAIGPVSGLAADFTVTKIAGTIGPVAGISGNLTNMGFVGAIGPVAGISGELTIEQLFAGVVGPIAGVAGTLAAVAASIQSYRYVRLRRTSGTGYIRLPEVAFYGAFADTVKIAGVVATATSQASTSESPDKAVDGDMATKWANNSGDNTAAITFDLGSVQPIAKMAISWDTIPATWIIEASTDNVTYAPFFPTEDDVPYYASTWVGAPLRTKIVPPGRVYRIHLQDTGYRRMGHLDLKVGTSSVVLRGEEHLIVSATQTATAEFYTNLMDPDLTKGWVVYAPAYAYLLMEDNTDVNDLVLTMLSTTSSDGWQNFTVSYSDNGFDGPWTDVLVVAGGAAWAASEVRTYALTH